MRKWFGNDLVFGAFWIAVIVLIFFFPVAIGRQSLTESVSTFYSRLSPDPQIKTPWQVDGGAEALETVPLVKTAVRTLRSGGLPLWASSVGGGQPLPSNLMVGLYYPLRLLFFFLWDSARAFDWYFILRFFIAGFGMFLYLRRGIRLGREAALWGGIAYAFTGYFILYLTYPFLDIDALLPWTLWAIERYARAPSASGASLVGFLLAMAVVIGHPQTTIVNLLFITLYAGWSAYRRRAELRGTWKRTAAHGAVAIAVALLVASPFIAEFLTSYGQGKTADDWYVKGSRAFPAARLLHFLVSPTAMYEVSAGGHLLDRFELIVPYIGISVLFLFLASLFLKQKRFPLLPLYAWIGFVMLKNAGFPLVQWIGKLPILSQVGWYKAYGPMAGAVAICAAVALDDISAVNWRRFFRLLAVIPLAIIAVWLCAPAAFRMAYVPDVNFANRDPALVQKAAGALAHLPNAAQELILSALNGRGAYFAALLFAEAALFAALALAVIVFLRNDRSRAAFFMIALTAFELWWYMPKVRDGFRYLDPYATTPPYVQFLQAQFAEGGAARIFPLGGVFAGQIGDLYGIEKLQNGYALKPRRYFGFLPDAMLEAGSDPGAFPAERLSAAPRKFFDAASIRYFVSETAPPPAAAGNVRLVYDRDMNIYENATALPKAYVVFQKQSVASPESARAAFYGPSFDPHAGVVIEDGGLVPLPPPAAGAEAPPFVPASASEINSNEVAVKTAAHRDGVLVLTDLFYPGWNAYLDGARVPIYPANVMFRGVYLPAGTHTVVFKYEPAWFWPSVALSLLTTAGVIAAFAYKKKELPVQAPTVYG